MNTVPAKRRDVALEIMDAALTRLRRCVEASEPSYDNHKEDPKHDTLPGIGQQRIATPAAARPAPAPPPH